MLLMPRSRQLSQLLRRRRPNSMLVGPEFDWSINLGTIIETVVLGVPIIWTSMSMYWTLREYRPHKHTRASDGKRAHIIGDTIISYPSGRND